jgi:hypothetical protein
MLSHDLRAAAEALRLTANAPAVDLRGALEAYAALAERAADRARELEAIIVRQQRIIALKAKLRRAWATVTTLLLEGAR